MKIKIFFLISFIISIVLFLIGADYYDSKGPGIPVFPQVVGATVSAPFTCAVGVRGKFIYVDDNNDTAESYLCFCGVDADDSTYIWLKASDPTNNCF